MTVGDGQSLEVHGTGQALLAVEADWQVASVASLVLADVWLVGGSGGAASVSVASGGELSLLRVEVGSGGAVTFSGSVTLSDCTVLGGTQLVGSTASSVLSVSGGTLTGATVSLSGGSATIDGSCVLVDSPVSIAAGTLSVSQCELQSDGLTVPLTIESGGSATVTGVVFRSSVDDITAVSVSDGGSLTVGESQLVGVDGRSDPFPCDGTLPNCVHAHVGPVDVAGPVAITLGSPLVCDAPTGECTADLCLRVFALGSDNQEDGRGTSAEVFNPQTNMWDAIASMAAARTEHSAVAIASRIYVLGGRNDDDGDLTSGEVYDTQTGIWSPIASMHNTHTRGVGAAVGSRIYVAGGFDSRSAEMYNTEDDTWVSVDPMSVVRADAAGVAVGSRIFVFGGVGHPAYPTNSAEVYATESNTWSSIASMPVGMANTQYAVAAVATRIYLIGGQHTTEPTDSGSPLSSVQVYDTDTDSWTAVASMTTARGDTPVAAAIGPLIYVAGGRCTPPQSGVRCGAEGSDMLNTVEMYDTDTGLWSSAASMSRYRYKYAGVAASACAWRNVCPSDQCSGHGTCALPQETCECTGGYSGDRCDVLPCCPQSNEYCGSTEDCRCCGCCSTIGCCPVCGWRLILEAL